jgi:cell division ATPase FtsA
MSAPSSSRRILHLAVDGFPISKLEEIKEASNMTGDVTEIVILTEANARETLEKIFLADGIAVWGEL